MGTPYRVFIAPPDASTVLPIAESPWRVEREAWIPLAHWELIIEFARTINHEKAELLQNFSAGSFKNDSYIDIAEPILTEIIQFMTELRLKLNSTDPIIKFKDRIFHERELLDFFDNDEYQRMLDAVIAVYKEGQRLSEPINASNN